MKPSRFLLGLLLTFLMAVAFSWLLRDTASAQQKAPEAAIKWEYKVLPFSKDAEKNLNQLGQEGWELGWTISQVAGSGGSSAGPGTPLGGIRFDTSVTLILKRPKR